MLCPKCNVESAHRSHREGLIEHAMSLFGWYPYRCKCGARFRRQRDAPPAVETKGGAKAVESEIRATRTAARRRIKRREFVLWIGAGTLFLAFLFYITRDHGSSSTDPH